MANLSDVSRKEQVYGYLKTRINAWVDGPELANESVGGSEGLKRLRELRADLKAEGGRYEIEMRSHPDASRDIYQYRLVERPIAPQAPPPVEHTEPAPAAPMQAANGVETERPPEWRNAPDRRGRVVYDPATETYVAVYDGPPIESDRPPELPGQTDMGVPEVEGFKYTRKPEKLELGKSINCPLCHGIHRAIKEKDPVTNKAAKAGKVIGYEELTRNPRKPSETCPRCNGFGLIPA